MILQCDSFPYFCHFSPLPQDHYIPELCISRSYIYTKSGPGTQKFIELWTDQTQTGDSALVQAKRHTSDIH